MSTELGFHCEIAQHEAYLSFFFWGVGVGRDFKARVIAAKGWKHNKAEFMSKGCP